MWVHSVSSRLRSSRIPRVQAWLQRRQQWPGHRISWETNLDLRGCLDFRQLGKIIEDPPVRNFANGGSLLKAVGRIISWTHVTVLYVWRLQAPGPYTLEKRHQNPLFLLCSPVSDRGCVERMTVSGGKWLLQWFPSFYFQWDEEFPSFLSLL